MTTRQESLSLFDVDELSDDEVALQLGVPNTSDHQPAVPPPLAHIASKPQGQRGELLPKAPHDSAPFLSAPTDQPDLFASLPEYDQLPAEWQGKMLRSWGADDRYVPIEIAISAVFTIGNNQVPRLSFNRERIPILNNSYDLYYTGLELRQPDELIFLQLLHLNRGRQPLGSPVLFKPSAFLKELDLKPATANYEHLKKAMHRLQATTLELYSHKYKKSKTFRFVCHFDFEDENHHPLPLWKVVLDPRLFYLLHGRYHARMSFRRRKMLGSGLASKLHSYFACHRAPIDRNINDYFRLCVGQEEALLQRFMQQRRLKRTSADSLVAANKAVAQKRRDFRRDMEEALQRLCSPEIGFLASYRFYKLGDEVFVGVERPTGIGLAETLDQLQDDADLAHQVLSE